jgi:hypothetical protein
MNDWINLSQVARFELLPDKVRVFYAVPELVNYDDSILGSRLSFEDYTGPVAEKLREWIINHRAIGDVAMTEL